MPPRKGQGGDMTPSEKNDAINAALDEFHKAADGQVRTVVASAAGVFAMRVEQALNGKDWRLDKADGGS